MFVPGADASAPDSPAHAEKRRLSVRRGETRLRAYDMKLADLRIAYIDPRNRVLQESIFHCEMTQIVRTHPINPGAELLQVKAFTKAILPDRAQRKNCIKTFTESFISKKA